MKKNNLIALIVSLLVFAGTLAGGLVMMNRKPDMYYTGKWDTVEFLESRFNLIYAPEIKTEGTCKAGKGDWIAWYSDTMVSNEDRSKRSIGSDRELSLVADLTSGGASALLFQGSGTSSYFMMFGTVYSGTNGSNVSVSSKVSREDVKRQMANAVWRKSGAFTASLILLVVAGIAFVGAAVFALMPLIKKKEQPEAQNKPAGWKRGVSIAAAIFNILAFAGWTVAWNIYAAIEPFTQVSWAIRLAGIPFAAFGVFALLNVIGKWKYRKWVNIVSIVLAGILFVYLLAGLIIALVQGTL